MTSLSLPEYSSGQPWPDQILDDIGLGFAAGAVPGSMYHFVCGMYNSPKGERVLGAAQAIRMNAPRIGGRFAFWSGLLNACNCCMAYIRQKEDPWNSVAAVAGASGFLNMRKGLRSASRSALCGGVLFGLMEGGLIMLRKSVNDLPFFGSLHFANAEEFMN